MIDLNHLKWIEFNKPWKVFEDAGRCKPGVLVEVKTPYEHKIFLIGHVNSDNTEASDFEYFAEHDLVIKYCVLIDFDQNDR